MSLFKNDLAQETILGTFLSNHYAKNNWNTTRIFEKEMQYKGVDVMLEKDGRHFLIDEKAQLHYLNKDLPTFALEINYLKENVLKDGWLFDTNKLTEIYAFVFNIQVPNAITQLGSVADIKCCDVVFVNKQKLLKELAILNLDYNTCADYSKTLRSNETIKKLSHYFTFNFQISSHLAEKPVNLIVRKAFLQQIGKQFIFKNEDF
jgi:hypothetical protein